ncbi:optineurin-like [Olea europaea var. sylvestris]|uniref:optineurin-like n=1 Tax=Olea europaea var. sylvestris TaxID=158386 RepID=UPI000C1CF218|nr:optineurin-like [Olea europaea var. sylvestris]
MAEAQALKTTSSTYKKQTEDLVATSKKLQPTVAEEEEEEAEAPLLKRGKQSKGPTVARTATHQTLIPIGGVIREKAVALPEARPAITTPGPIPTAPRDHTTSHTEEDLASASTACLAKAPTTSIQLEAVVKDLRAKNVDLAKRLEVSLQYGEAVQEAKAKTVEAEKKRVEVESQLGRANSDVERLRKELYETESQVDALKRRLDHASEHHRLATKALEASNKEKAELRQRAEAQAEEIESLKAEVKVVGESAMQHFIDHFEKHPLYDTFAKYWPSWNAQAMLEWLKEVHPTLDISALEVELDGPTEGRPDVASAEEVAEPSQEVEVGDKLRTYVNLKHRLPTSQ